MCAALSARNDPQQELAFAVSLISRVLAAAGGTRTGLHVCRGNWSRDESTLLSGSYAPLQPWFAQLPATQLVLEYATPRAAQMVPRERLFLNPDCGFGTFAARPMNAPEVASQKLAAMGEAARRLRGQSAPTHTPARG